MKQADDIHPPSVGALSSTVKRIHEPEAETALRIERERLALALTAGQMGVYDLSLRDGILWWSPEIYTVFGVCPDTFTPTRESFTELVHPEDRAGFWQRMDECMVQRKYFVHEFRIRRPDGQERWIGNRAQTEYDETGAAVRHFGVAIDITERKNSEMRNRQNAELFSKLIDQAPIGTYVVDEHLCIRQVNPVALPAFPGIDPLIGRSLDEMVEILWGSEIGKGILAQFQHTLTTGERYVSPRFAQVRHDHGNVEAYEWEIQRVVLPEGGFGVVCYFSDVTSQHRAQKALQESEDRMRLATAATGVGIWEWNVVTNAIWWDASLFEIYGIPPTQDGMVHYSDWSGAVLSEDLVENVRILQETIRNGGSSARSFRIRRRSDGAVRHLQCVETTRSNALGQTEWVVGTNLDVTERKLAEAALVKSERFNTAVLDSLPAELAVLDVGGRIIAVNKPWVKFSQNSESIQLDRVAVGADYLEVCRKAAEAGDEVAEQTLAGINDVLEGRAAEFKIEYPCHAPDAERWFAMHVIRTSAEVGGAIVAHTDITERRKLETALMAHATELAEADRRKDEFLAMLAHELRNPLAPMRNTAELLKAGAVSGEEKEQSVGMLTRQIENMTRMIDDLLDVSRITQGKIDLRKVQVDLGDVLTSAVSLARAGCEARGQQLFLQLPAEAVRLHADATRLEQVFGNLLSNARKYSPDGSPIRVSAARDGNEVVITVSDSGVGIDPQLLPRIFELFVQESRTLDRERGGLGIGLTLAERLVKLHGGCIMARSNGLGHGAEFTVRLPVLMRGTPLTTNATETLPGVSADRSRRILIVDDNKDSARSLELLHKSRGHETLTAFTGPDALLAAAKFLPEVVILDIGLPGMDGFEVARQLRALPAFATTLLIAMSGYGGAEDVAKGKLAGFDEYLVKPVNLKLLRELIRQ